MVPLSKESVRLYLICVSEIQRAGCLTGRRVALSEKARNRDALQSGRAPSN
jgi:hypothetical protein